MLLRHSTERTQREGVASAAFQEHNYVWGLMASHAQAIPAAPTHPETTSLHTHLQRHASVRARGPHNTIHVVPDIHLQHTATIAAAAALLLLLFLLVLPLLPVSLPLPAPGAAARRAACRCSSLLLLWVSGQQLQGHHAHVPLARALIGRQLLR